MGIMVAFSRIIAAGILSPQQGTLLTCSWFRLLSGIPETMSLRTRLRKIHQTSQFMNGRVGLCLWACLWLQGLLWFQGCTLRTFRLAVVPYLVSAPIRTHGLGQPAHRAWSSVASADTPLAYELATAFAGHSVSLFSLVEFPDNTHAQKVFALGGPGLISASTREP